MKLQIKQLKGETLEVEISENNKIAELKQIISKSTKVPASQLTLLHVGKTLLDDKLIDTYPTIKDGTKLNLVIKKPEPLNDVLIKFLSKWYTKEQCIKITDAFMKDFKSKADSLSWDDLERIATAWYAESSS